jgi:hypothetical protein
MRTLTVRTFVAALFFAAAAIAFGNPFKSKIITGTDSTLVITVPDEHFLKITNFSQVGGTDRGAVHLTLQDDTGNGGSTKVLAAARIDLSTGTNWQNVPDISNQAIIAGPATVRVPPITGATLFITYKKELNEGGGGDGGGGEASPTAIPIFSPTPGVTATPTATPFIFPTPTPFIFPSLTPRP